jgi:hypothetical protein
MGIVSEGINIGATFFALPISEKSYLLGRFLGSFLTLAFVFLSIGFVAEQNTQTVALSGFFLYNRLLWLGLKVQQIFSFDLDFRKMFSFATLEFQQAIKKSIFLGNGCLCIHAFGKFMLAKRFYYKYNLIG